MTKVEVHVPSIDATVSQLADKQRLMDKIGTYLVSTTQARIKTLKKGPDGAPWHPWAPRTYMARAKAGTLAGGLLYNTGGLFNSVSHHVAGDTVEVSSSAPYARYLQLGTKNMPARPFLGISKDDESAVAGIVRRHLRA